MEKRIVNFILNGEPTCCEVPENWTLLRMLRDGLNMTGTKCSCDQGECGACTVQVDGDAITSCTFLAVNAEGRRIETIEGLEKDGKLHPLQEAFMALGAIQCGFCTPGMIMCAKALLEKNPHPTRQEIREAMSGNICRCTGYEHIVDAVEAAASGTAGEWTITDSVYSIAPERAK